MRFFQSPMAVDTCCFPNCLIYLTKTQLQFTATIYTSECSRHGLTTPSRPHSSKDMAGTGIWRCKNACFFSWAPLTKVSALLRQPESQRHLKSWRFNRVDRTLVFFFFFFFFLLFFFSFQTRFQINFIRLKNAIVRNHNHQTKRMKPPSTHSLDMFRHPKEGHFNSHRVNPRFPLSAPSQWWPTLINVFWVQRDKGEYKKAFRIGGVLSEFQWRTLEWKLRMKVDFHHKFVVKQVDGVRLLIELTHPRGAYLQQTTMRGKKPTNKGTFVSVLHHK